jgi:hypothetical protein
LEEAWDEKIKAANLRFGMRGRAASGAWLPLMVSMSGKSLMQKES